MPHWFSLPLLKNEQYTVGKLSIQKISCRRRVEYPCINICTWKAYIDTKLRLLKLKVKTGEISLHLRIFSIKSQSPYLPLKKENFKKLCFLAMWYKVKSSLTVNTIRTRSIISNYPFLDTPMVGTPCSTDWVREAANCPAKSFCLPTTLLIGKGLAIIFFKTVTYFWTKYFAVWLQI